MFASTRGDKCANRWGVFDSCGTDQHLSDITVELTRRRESKRLRRTKQVEKHAPAARVQRFVMPPREMLVKSTVFKDPPPLRPHYTVGGGTTTAHILKKTQKKCGEKKNLKKPSFGVWVVTKKKQTLIQTAQPTTKKKNSSKKTLSVCSKGKMTIDKRSASSIQDNPVILRIKGNRFQHDEGEMKVPLRFEPKGAEPYVLSITD